MKKYREILFRGRCKDTNQLIYGSLITHNSPAGVAYYIFVIEDEIKQPFMYRVIPESIQQYTGFKDKHNNKIFEGDELTEVYKIENKVFETVYRVYFEEETNSFFAREVKPNINDGMDLSVFKKDEIQLIKDK